MKKALKHTIVSILLLLPLSVFSQGNNYKYVLDLTNVVDDKLMVTLITPAIEEQEILFNLPKIIPGTYRVADYGRFVNELKAFDKKDRELKVERLDDNSWKISKANKMVKLTYWVDDTFDSQNGGSIYPMAGTNIEAEANFVINTSGFFGYFEGMKELPFDLSILRADSFYGSTGLKPVYNYELSGLLEEEMLTISQDGTEIDHFATENYNHLIDSPIMYCEPDTAIIDVAGTEVLISVYSPTRQVTSSYVAENIEEILLAQKEYLGGSLPVEKYAFIFYCEDLSRLLPIQGALEHSYSSFYYFPDMEQESLLQGIRDAAAHEFFHIITPLNIHSEEIHYFDYNEPNMSQHLWLYEGMTEYFAGNVQVKYGILSEEEYLQMMREKMVVASQNFNDTLSFTDLSKHTLTLHSSQYVNVYYKGALNGMCMDIMLLDLSNGDYGVQELIAELSEKYGKDQPFKDEELFDDVESMTYPEIREYLETFIVEGDRLPYADVFKKVGIDYSDSKLVKEYSLGRIGIGYNPNTGHLYVSSTQSLNEFGLAMGYQDGDVILAVNGTPLPENLAVLQEFFDEARNNMQEGEIFSVTVMRKNEEGIEEEIILQTETFKVETLEEHILAPMENPTERQLRLKEAWLKPRT
jgi:predicted metalloprotease with PDZ domain